MRSLFAIGRTNTARFRFDPDRSVRLAAAIAWMRARGKALLVAAGLTSARLVEVQSAGTSFRRRTASVGLVENADFHRDRVELARLLQVILDQSPERGIRIGAFLLEATVNEISATTPLDGDVHQTHTFCPAQPVVGCRFGELPRTGRPVFLDGRQVLVLSFSLRSLVLLSARSGVVVGEGEVPVVP